MGLISGALRISYGERDYAGASFMFPVQTLLPRTKHSKLTLWPLIPMVAPSNNSDPGNNKSSKALQNTRYHLNLKC